MYPQKLQIKAVHSCGVKTASDATMPQQLGFYQYPVGSYKYTHEVTSYINRYRI